jgi:hypothetical protein
MASLVRRANEDPISYNLRSSTADVGFGNYTANIELQNEINTPEECVKTLQQNESTDTDAASITFNPGYRFYLAFTALAVLAMMVALDGTTVSVALPVCIISSTDLIFSLTPN